jgi:hypothetical protein
VISDRLDALEYSVGVVKYFFVVAGQVRGMFQQVSMGQLVLENVAVKCVEHFPVDILVYYDVNIIYKIFRL